METKNTIIFVMTVVIVILLIFGFSSRADCNAAIIIYEETIIIYEETIVIYKDLIIKYKDEINSLKITQEALLLLK